MPQVFFGLLAVYLLYRFFETRALKKLALSGMALGVAFLFLQKALLLIAALAPVIAWRARCQRLTARDLGVFVAAMMVLPIVYVGYMWGCAGTGTLSFF